MRWSWWRAVSAVGLVHAGCAPAATGDAQPALPQASAIVVPAPSHTPPAPDADDPPPDVSIDDVSTGATIDCQKLTLDGSPKIKSVLEAWPRVALAKLDRTRLAPGGFNTLGIVTKRFVPKPCPRGVACKPQAPRHVVLADEQDNARTLTLRTADPMSLDDGARIEVSAALCNTHNFGGTVNSGFLIAAVDR